MTVDSMRYLVKEAYPGKAWKKKVSKMSDTQIIAIYKRLEHDGKIKIASPY